ncbi:hypothetical protein [Streptosporangium roseum]|uniref:hypothetical protein n=1 Tax=Streptosporangium roseum TaxID=2001 RepID=UPI000A87CD68|nr:hypothetical protein [Streptosporangium roseum]
MSFEEKRAWIYALVAAGVPLVYFATVLGQAQAVGVAEVAYVRPMLTAIGVAVAVNVVAHIVAGIVSPGEADRKDERDADIHRYGQRAGYYVLAAGAVVALGLTLADYENFWIANALYLAFVLDALTSSVTKIVAYRRGL